MTDTDPDPQPKRPDLGWSSNIIFQIEKAISDTNRWYGEIENKCGENVATPCIGARHALENLRQSLRIALYDNLYDCERAPRPYNRSEGA